MRMGPAFVRAVAAALFLQQAPALAEEGAGEAGPALHIELNALQPSERGCRISFVATNGLSADLSKAAFEAVLFDRAGMVERITVLDFRDLPAGRARVRQFELAGADCEGVSRVLLNGATACEGAGIASDACARIETSTTGSVAFSG